MPPTLPTEDEDVWRLASSSPAFLGRPSPRLWINHYLISTIIIPTAATFCIELSGVFLHKTLLIFSRNICGPFTKLLDEDSTMLNHCLSPSHP